MLQLPGPPALSAFRIAKLLARLRALEPAVDGAAARFVHFVDLARTARRAEQRGAASSCSTYGPRLPAAAGGAATRERAAGGAARRHDLALVEQGDRHRAGLRTRGACGASSAASRTDSQRAQRARRRSGCAQLAAAAARPHDRDGAARCRGRPRGCSSTRRRGRCSAIVARRRAARRSRRPNRALGLALSADEIDYLLDDLPRARARSDRRRADDVRAGQLRALPPQDLQRATGSSTASAQPKSLFAMIRNTDARNPHGRAVGLSRQRRGDRGRGAARAASPIRDSGIYRAQRRADRHPDEGRDAQPSDRDLAVPGRGHRRGRRDPRRGRDRPRRQAQGRADRLLGVATCAFPGFEQPWERSFGKPARIASALEIMLEGPIGAACLQQRVRPAGDLRLFPHLRARTCRGDPPGSVRGYHKPIMIAGGLGNVRRAHVEKAEVPVGAQLVRARRPGDADRPGRRRRLLGGQRQPRAPTWISPRCSAATPEMQRRAQEVIDRCWALGERQPDPAHPRRRRGRPVQCRARGGGAQPARRALRPARDPERRARHVAAGDLVQRGAGALRAGRRAAGAGALRGHRARASAARSP